MKTKITVEATGNARCLKCGVIWRVWHLDQHRWLWDGREFETQREAFQAKVKATAGRRNPLTNWLRICAIVVDVQTDGTSPLRDAAQKEWDAKMKTPDNGPDQGRRASDSKQP